MAKAITLLSANTDQNSHVLDVKGPLGSNDELKSICIVWHGQATGEMDPPDVGPSVDVDALRSSLVERSVGTFHANLVVSAQIFGELSASLSRNDKLRVAVTDHGDSPGTFQIRKLAALEEGDVLPAIAETVTRLDRRVERIEGHVGAIHAILQRLEPAPDGVVPPPGPAAYRTMPRRPDHVTPSNGTRRG